MEGGKGRGRGQARLIENRKDGKKIERKGGIGQTTDVERKTGGHKTVTMG